MAEQRKMNAFSRIHTTFRIGALVILFHFTQLGTFHMLVFIYYF